MRTKKAKEPKELEFMDKYKLTADAYNIILQEKYHNKKQDTIGWQNIAYFSNPTNALDYVIENEIREAWVDDLKAVIKEMGKLYESIRGINSNLPGD